MKERKMYGIRIIAAFMSFVTVISFAGCSAKKSEGSKGLTTESNITGDNEKNGITVTEPDGNKPTATGAVNSKDGKSSSDNSSKTNNASATKSLDSILKRA